MYVLELFRNGGSKDLKREEKSNGTVYRHFSYRSKEATQGGNSSSGEFSKRSQSYRTLHKLRGQCNATLASLDTNTNADF